MEIPLPLRTTTILIIGVTEYAALGIGSNSLLVTESRAMMNFNALQVVLRQHLSHGAEFTVNYTYGRAMTNSLGNYALNVNGYSGAFQNYYNSAADYGPAGYDVRNNLSANGVYALPVGRGQQYLSDANRFVDEAIGGWKIAVATVAYSGFPQSLTGGSNNSNSYGDNRVNQYRKLRVVESGHQFLVWHRPFGDTLHHSRSGQRCLCFWRAGGQRLRDSSNGAVRGPGYFNMDLSAFKSFTIYKEQAFEFRFDAFNAFNIVSYGNPDTTVTDTAFGQIGSQNSIRSQERRLQFSAKYSF